MNRSLNKHKNIELRKTAQSFCTCSASYNLQQATMKKVSASVEFFSEIQCYTVAPWNLEAQKGRKFVSSQSVKRR